MKAKSSFISDIRELIGNHVDKFRLRHNIRREYFTIGIPVLVAVVMVAALVLTGMTSSGSGAGDSDVADERAAAYEELVRQLEAEERGETLSAETPVPESEAEVPEPIPLDQVVIIATLIGMTPYAIDVTFLKHRRKKQEELYTEFLFKLSELMRGGLDPIKSVKELSKTDMGILNRHVRLAANLMGFGASFEDAMRKMTESLKSELIRRYTDLVIQASYSGASVSDLILKASEDMRSILEIEREKEGNLSQYVMIFYFAQGIIVFIAYTMNSSLLPYFSQLGSSTFLGENKIANIDFSTGFFHLIIVNSFFGGLIIGKIAEGDIKYGLKHCVILVTACYIASLFLILPVPVSETGGDAVIEIVSGYDQEGLAGLPLKDPIVIGVTDLEGNPVVHERVDVSVSHGGTAEETMTNLEGIAQIVVTMGPEEATQTVTITCRGVSETVTIAAFQT